MDPNFICHHLNVNPTITPKKQLPRRPSKEPADAVRNEVMKLKQVGAIKKVFYSEWLANTVVVKKKNRKWRVCVNFTDLNKACLKDPFPIPQIDQLMDATVGHPRMSFLDAFQRDHQIQQFHSSIYKSDHWNADFTHFSICEYQVWGTVL